MNEKLDVSEFLAIKMVYDRAMEGDERVLRIAREKAEQGNQFAKWLLEEVERAKGVGAKE